MREERHERATRDEAELANTRLLWGPPVGRASSDDDMASAGTRGEGEVALANYFPASSPGFLKAARSRHLCGI